MLGQFQLGVGHIAAATAIRVHVQVGVVRIKVVDEALLCVAVGGVLRRHGRSSRLECIIGSCGDAVVVNFGAGSNRFVEALLNVIRVGCIFNDLVYIFL